MGQRLLVWRRIVPKTIYQSLIFDKIALSRTHAPILRTVQTDIKLDVFILRKIGFGIILQEILGAKLGGNLAENALQNLNVFLLETLRIFLADKFRQKSRSAGLIGKSLESVLRPPAGDI